MLTNHAIPGHILGLTQNALEAAVAQLGVPAYRARQMHFAVFHQGCSDLNAIAQLPKALRGQLAQHFDASLPRIDQTQVSIDGTRKYRFVASDGGVFEAVYIPEVARGRKTNTLCVSSQTGCAVGCKFCFTASLRRNRDLTAAEIVGQLMAVQKDVTPLGSTARVSNIVFMGMGEPLLNYANVVQAISVLTDEAGCNLSTRRITVSTSGIVPRIYDLGAQVQTQLAISLNATTDAVRDVIMPINRKWPIASLIQAMRDYPLPPRRRITVEYVLLGGTNDSPDDAKRLVKLLQGIPVKINLLPLNAHERTELKPPRPADVAHFQSILRQANMNAILRTPRGQDISAACGQLGETVAKAAA